MRFLHLADLHIGKKVNGYSMLELQNEVLKQAIDIVIEKKVQTVLISGDVFDRSVPSYEAMDILDNFLNRLTEINVNCIMISGNHDSNERLSFLSNFLKKSNIYISKPFGGEIEYVDIEDNYRIYLMPYLYPALIRSYYPDVDFVSYNEAIKFVLDKLVLDKKKINILLAHQFVIGSGEPILSDSETKSVGAIESIDYNLFEKFNYTALGHLHCAQKIGIENIRYAGSILKYSFSEVNHKKYFTIFEFDKNKQIKFDFVDICYSKDLVELKGKLEEFLNPDFYNKIKKDDYIHFILTDDFAPDAKKRLSLYYPNIMLLEFDNKYTNNQENLNFQKTKDKTCYEHFLDFYENQTNEKIDEFKEKIITEILDEINNAST